MAIPSLNNKANYGRFNVCFLSPGVSYPPVYGKSSDNDSNSTSGDGHVDGDCDGDGDNNQLKGAAKEMAAAR